MNENIATVNTTNNIKNYKFPYIGHILTDVKQKHNTVCKFFCKNLNIKFVLTPFKVGNIFNVKDPVPKSLKSCVVYKFTCPGCNACCIDETNRYG